jgi:hypothetical protein
MSEDNNNPSKAVQGVLNTLKSNPKALYAAIGAVVVIILVLAMSGGGEEVQIKTSVSVGQQVTLDNPNGGGSHLTTTPGLVSTSEAEEDQEQSVCVTKAGTKGTVEEEMVVGQLPFVKVKVLDGDCQGKSGWTSKVNVKGG